MRSRLGIAEEIVAFLKRPISQPQMRLASFMYLDKLPAAWDEWGAVVGKFSKKPPEEVDPERAEDSLALWLEKMEIEDTDITGQVSAHQHEHQHPVRPAHGVNMNELHLYRCSWCGNPSAVLKRCKRCQKARWVIYMVSMRSSGGLNVVV